MPYEHLVLDFLAYLEFERGLSRNTLEAYRSDLLQFGEWLQRTGRDPLNLDHAGLTQFVVRARGGPRGQAGRQARHAAAEGRVPALLPPPPAAPEPDRGRPDRAAQGAAAEPQAPAGAHARRGRQAARPAVRRRAGRAARPRAARGHVRLRPAGLGGDRPRGRRPRPRGGRAARPRQGLQGAPRAGRQRRGARARHLPRPRPPAAGRRPLRGAAVRQPPRRTA